MVYCHLLIRESEMLNQTGRQVYFGRCYFNLECCRKSLLPQEGSRVRGGGGENNKVMSKSVILVHLSSPVVSLAGLPGDESYVANCELSQALFTQWFLPL